MALLKKLSLNILSIVILLIFLFGLFVFYILKAELKPVIQEINLSESIAIPNILLIHNTFHEVESGENMTVIFEKYTVPKNLTYEILNSEFKKSFSDLKPGEKFIFKFIGEKLDSITLTKSPRVKYFVENLQNPQVKEVKYKPKFIKEFRAGIIENNFFMAGLNGNIPESILMDFAYIFGWDIDFIFDIKGGERFEVLYETGYVNGEKIDNGSILYAKFIGRNNQFKAYRFSNRDGKITYFDQYGNSLKKAFLRAPLSFNYISSHFNPNRKHPILNTIRAHTGVDYAAARGTPVRSTGDGVIMSIGVRGGYGNTIEIRHGGEIKTLYAHLDKFNTDLKVGSKIKQGDLIGYVGDSGLATAPHLHYEFMVGKLKTDPVKVKLPSTEPVPNDKINEFNNLMSALDKTVRIMK